VAGGSRPKRLEPPAREGSVGDETRYTARGEPSTLFLPHSETSLTAGLLCPAW
jgi:hypothetical protein